MEIVKDYKVILDEYFARGTTGILYLAKRSLFDKEVVIKQVSKEFKSFSDLERKSLELLRGHPNIVKLIDFNQSERFDHIILERAPGYDLFSVMERRNFQSLGEIESKLILNRLISALRYCHSRRIAHRDIKLENVIYEVATSRVTLIDFGFCHIGKTHDEKCEDYCGTAAYASPEICRHEPYQPIVADVWSLAVLWFTLLFGKFPFSLSRNGISTLEQYELTFPNEIILTDNAKNMMTSMLQMDPLKRITIQGLYDSSYFNDPAVLVMTRK